MCFDVLIFENQTSCEKVSSYFLDVLDTDKEDNKFGESSSSEHAMASTDEALLYASESSRIKKFGRKPVVGGSGQQVSCLGRASKRLKETVKFPVSADENFPQQIDMVPETLVNRLLLRTLDIFPLQMMLSLGNIAQHQ